MDNIIGAQIWIQGIVQGVGFRPFVYALAKRFSLPGWVRNTSAGVEIEVDGSPESIQDFVQALKDEAPPLARINELKWEFCPIQGFTSFTIIPSQPIPDAFQPISPDVGICDDCLRELTDPNDRRYLYPFINCTNCGPRFTIIEDIPYDRPKTTMASFDMCPECTSEYNNPLDRRFHAQPIACPQCGPQVWLEDKTNTLRESIEPLEGYPAIAEVQKLLKEGKIVAIKGIGGFHLACDALNVQAVNELRRRKLRVDKPFALMLPDLDTIQIHCELNEVEKELLLSHQKPIVILKRRPSSTIAREVAPGQETIGVMLPYSPLHHLLFFSPSPKREQSSRLEALVMTSGNLSEEPIAIDNEDAQKRLASLADAFLFHNRPIRTRCDDSVIRTSTATEIAEPATMPIRRSRGYAPFPVLLPWKAPPLLAVGAELKNTFCVTRDQFAFLSHHIGDMENFETYQSFIEGIQHLERLFRVTPQAIAYDLHPDYLATRYAQERAAQMNLQAIGVQHHHAHIAACMAEHLLPDDSYVIGVAFDGTGYGEDGAIWGGEFLLADYQKFERPFHLEYLPLPGGDKAIREPWRIALSWLQKAGIEWSPELNPVRFVLQNQENGKEVLNILHQQIKAEVNSPLTSSMGRLFDAVSSLIGVRQVINYEAQAAIELEALVDPEVENFYSIEFNPHNAPAQKSSAIGLGLIMEMIVKDLRQGLSIPKIAAKFHNTIAHMVLQVCQKLRSSRGINVVVLSGGVWQNVTLLEKTFKLLKDNRFACYTHHQVPTNDGGIALGQAAIAVKRINVGVYK